MNVCMSRRTEGRTMSNRFGIGMILTFALVAPAPGDIPKPTASESAPYGKTLTLNLGEGVTLELILIPAGEFMMGSPESEEGRSNNEGPQRRVRISGPFYMGKHEVTVGQFRRFVAATGYVTDAEKGGQPFEDGKRGGYVVQPDGSWGFDEQASWQNPGFEQGDDHPVVLISWADATAFIHWLSQSSGKKIRFPTEAEWEYAARGKATTRFWWGDDEDRTGRVANVADRSFGRRFADQPIMDMDDGFVFTSPVGRFRPNGFGLFDTSGNVWEWCSDWYRADFDTDDPGIDPTGPASGTHRVMRGGSWDSAPKGCRSATRYRGGPSIRSLRVGFRVAAGA